jgi:hypothetical protein
MCIFTRKRKGGIKLEDEEINKEETAEEIKARKELEQNKNLHCITFDFMSVTHVDEFHTKLTKNVYCQILTISQLKGQKRIGTEYHRRTKT